MSQKISRRDVLKSLGAFSAAAALPYPPIRKRSHARRPTESPETMELGHAVQAAGGADTFVALERPLPQMARIAANFPFLDTPIGAEGATAWRHFEVAPAAQGAAVRTLREVSLINPATWHGTYGTHLASYMLSRRSRKFAAR